MLYRKIVTEEEVLDQIESNENLPEKESDAPESESFPEGIL
jgi:hypothetical protein